MTLEEIRQKPIWRLTPNELASLPDDEARWAGGLLFDMKKDGTLAMLAANEPGTRYETVADRERGWVLRPRCFCDTDLLDEISNWLGLKQQFAFIEAYFDYHGSSAVGDRPADPASTA